MKNIQITVSRGEGQDRTDKTYQLSVEENSTVLEALLTIYDTQDSSLAFSHGCRVSHCGLCVVNVNGKPRYACIQRISDGAHIEPLYDLPVVKDLVLDREYFFDYMSKFTPYVIRETPMGDEPETLKEPPEYSTIISGTECFACLSACPAYDDNFGGPLGLLKLAQLHNDVRDTLDRVAQTKEMGIENCLSCGHKNCVACIAGIPLKKMVIDPLLLLIKEK